MKEELAIINISVGTIGSWYHRGQEALRDSLGHVGGPGMMFFCSMVLDPGHELDRSVYDEKVLAIKEAATQADMILWLDCSITAVRQLNDIWKYIEENGVYLYQSGANCAQTCNDHCIESYGITRDEAEKIPECASNVVGINLNHPIGKKFFDLWMESLENGANIGYKWPNEHERISESTDYRFKYHRQDQSSASLAAHLAGVKLEPEGHFVVRHENLDYHKNDSIIFVLKGGVGE
jgi:hypothetical protein